MTNIVIFITATQFIYFPVSAHTDRLYGKLSRNQLLKRTTCEKPHFTEHALKELILIRFYA